MIEISTLNDIAALAESFEVECKLAAGKDGDGAVPKSFWETYSAFANSHGGEVFLGIKELKGGFEVQGIRNPVKVREDLWNQLNNPQKVSVNLLRDVDVREVEIDGKTILHVHVPRAQRRQKPVFVGSNPITGTYRRQNSGDYLCDPETVKRMLAEQVEDSRDNELLKGYGIEDIDFESFNAYRQMFATLKPDHPWNQAEAQEFLRNIGAWRIDRDSARGSLTRAGLLMFGKQPVILEAFPNYMLDYQERADGDTQARWLDRLTLDGTWSGNLFDFYRRVIKKLTSDLKVPFALKGDQRLEDTLVHQALREAMVNTLVHADFTGRASVYIVKRPDMFGFRNPGLMRVPQEQAIAGGESDCRNRLLHAMFRYVGLGEQAGSGIPKIYQGWDSQHWRPPTLYEKTEPSDQTLLELRMIDLLPEGVAEGLRQRFGQQFDALPKLERLILATAATEQVVSHARLGEITTEHAHDLTLAFQALVRKGLLMTQGQGRGTTYHLPGANFPTPEQAFGASVLPSGEGGSSGHYGGSSGHYSPSSGHYAERSGQSPRSQEGWLDVEGLDRPLVDDLQLLKAEILSELWSTGQAARAKGRMPQADMEQVILDLCRDHYMTLPVLAALLDRKPDPLRKNYLKPLVEQGRVALAFPAQPTDPRQAYTTRDEDQ